MMPCIYKKRMGVLNTPRWLRQAGFGSHSPPEKHHREIRLIRFLSQPKPQFELLGKRKCAKPPTSPFAQGLKSVHQSLFHSANSDTRTYPYTIQTGTHVQVDGRTDGRTDMRTNGCTMEYIPSHPTLPHPIPSRSIPFHPKARHTSRNILVCGRPAVGVILEKGSMPVTALA